MDERKNYSDERENIQTRPSVECKDSVSAKEKKQGKGKEKKHDILEPANKKGRHVNKLLFFLRFVLLPVVWLLFPFRFYGNRRIPDGPYIYIGNHYRLWDVAYPACTTTEGIHYLAKSELRNVPVVGAACRGAKVIFLERNGEVYSGMRMFAFALCSLVA